MQMTKSRYHVSLYVIVPIIMAGMVIFSSVVTNNVAEYCARQSLDGSLPIFFWIGLSSLLAFGCGLLLVKLMLGPMQKFIETARKIPTINVSQGKNDTSSGDELQQFRQVFEQVTHVLSKVEAKEFFPEIIGESRAMLGLFSQIRRIAPSDTTILIMGESGTGKELVATAIFKNSNRRDKPFIKINCVAIPSELLESELFGHEKGAFTGATSMKPGKFEIANGGTVFLDEIGDMPMALQGKLLRVLQEREFDRVGGTSPIKVDVRFIAATHRNLEQLVREGRFREDLYYRLNVVSLVLPALRERKEDIALLAKAFIKRMPQISKISRDAMDMLIANNWPGNVRQLQNTLERSALLAEGEVIGIECLPADIREADFEKSHLENAGADVSLDLRLQRLEKQLILHALHKTGGVQVKAAQLLGIKERSLWHRIRKYEIDVTKIKDNGLS